MMDSYDSEKNSTTLPRVDSESEEPILDPQKYLKGWNLHMLTVGLYIATFLVNLEISIVSTSLVSITDDLKSFSQSSWVVTAYLLTYTSFMLIMAKLSDLYGRKMVLLISVFIFVVFSGGCAAAHTMVQLIVCRAFQGIGGCGVYAIVMVVIFEMVPPTKYSNYYSSLIVLYTISMTAGPIVGGVINDQSSWIWVFLINVPAGMVCMVLIGIFMPNAFPNHRTSPSTSASPPTPPKHASRRHRIDYLGGILLLAAMTMHIIGFEEAANLHPWKSRTVLIPLVLSVPLWIAFICSQYYVTNHPQQLHEPVFPWRCFKNHVAMSLIANAFLSGAIQTTMIITIPIRSQAAIGLTALKAGVYLLPYTLSSELGAFLVAMFVKKRRLAPVYLGLLAAVLQLVGVSLLSLGPIEDPGYKAMYGIEVVVGLGVGAAIAVTTLMMPYATEKRDLSVGTALIIQFRFLGGATAVAIVTAVANAWLRENLSGVLSMEETAALFRRPDSVQDLAESMQSVVQGLFVKSFNLQMRILIGFAGAQVPIALLAWKREQIRIN